MKFHELLAQIDGQLRQLGLSEREACLVAGLKVDAIRTIRRGHPPTLSKLRLLAGALELPLLRLTDAATDLRLDEAPGSPKRHEAAGSAFRSYVGVARLPSETRDAPSRRGGAGTVLFSERLISIEFRGKPDDFVVIEIEGSAMAPVLRPRDEILVDMRQKRPAQPGLFALDEGLGPIVRWTEFVPGSDPPRYRIRAEDQQTPPYEVQADTARILGRAVWLGRYL